LKTSESCPLAKDQVSNANMTILLFKV
jgi:hypothetical protein